MATNLKRVEKEFILSAARDGQIPLILIAGSGEWPCTITGLSNEGLTLAHAIPLRLVKRNEVYELRFMYREQTMAFRARVLEVKEAAISMEMPDAVYKNLGRRYSRRRPPSDLAVAFSFKGDRYELSFPTTREFEEVTEPEHNSAFDPRDIKVLVAEFDERAQAFASERAIRMFKGREPESPEERIIVRTGKIYYLPSSAGGLPVVDPYVEPRIITRDDFAAFFLDSDGVREDLVEDEVTRFERNKKSSGVLSEMMVPVLFQEYVIGYVYLVNTTEGKPPFDLPVLETFHQFAKVLAYSLVVNGYFRSAPKKPQSFTADVLDISAGGLLFSSASRQLNSSLLPGSEIEVAIKAKGRIVKVDSRVKRVYKDLSLSYFGIEYEGMEPEDFRFVFECLYGRPFTDEDAASIEGLGVKGLRK